MKKILLFLCILLGSKHLYSQWIPVDTIQVEWGCNPSPLYYTFKYLNSNNVFWYWQRGFCSPSNPEYFTIAKTNDSFLTNQELYECGGSAGNSGVLYNFYPITPDTIYITCVCGSAFYFFKKTTDGGSTWINIPNTYPSKLTFINGHLGYDLTGNSLFRFYNDSLYFVSNINNVTINSYQMFFADSLRGLILSGPTPYVTDTIIRTIDGGLTWTQIVIDPTRTFYSNMELINDSLAFIYADSGYIYKTKDFGNSWTIALQNSSMGKIHFLNEKRAYSVFTDSLHNMYYNSSNDSGLTWISTDLQIDSVSGNIKMFDDSTGYINFRKHIGSSYYDIILKTVNNGGIIFNPADSDSIMISVNEFIIAPNPTSGIFFITTPDEFSNEEYLTLQILDNTGKLLQQTKIEMLQEKVKVNLEDKSIGVYYIILSNGKKNYNGKIVFE